MADEFEIGDAVWAKMKGFPAWPGKIIKPMEHIRKPSQKKPAKFVFFFGSNNYAWITHDNMWQFEKHKDRFTVTNRVPRGFKEALEAVETYIKTGKDNAPKMSELPTVDDEISLIHGKDGKKKPKPKKPKLEEKEEDKMKEKNKRTRVRPSSRRGSSSESSGDESKKPLKRSTSSSSDTKAKKSKVEKEKSVTSNGESSALSDSEKTSDKDQQSKRKADGNASDSEYPSMPELDGNSESVEISYTTLMTKSADCGRSLFSRLSSFLPASQYKSPDLGASSTDSSAPADVIPTPMKIGFIGLGIMGQGMVMNLLKSGHEVTVWNRTTMKCRDFVKAGAMKAPSATEVVKGCDITFCCVSDPQAVRELTFGNHSILTSITHGKALVDMSTVDVDTVTDLYEAVTARGGRFLEAPVSGNRQSALDGQLVILAAGDKSLYDDCYSCFKAMGKKLLYLGDVGNAARLKLVANLVMGVTIAGLAEGLALAEKVGIKQEDVLDILNLGELSCDLLRNKGQAMLIDDYDPSHPLQHQQKDLRLALTLGDSVDQSLGVTAAANELYKKAKAIGYAENDASAVYKASIF